MPQLDISTFLPQLFWLFLSFSLLYFLLSKLCLPKIAKIFEDRDLAISQSLSAAHAAKNEAARLKAEYEIIMKQAWQTKHDRLAQTSKELDAMVEAKIAAFDKALDIMMHESMHKMRRFEVENEKEVKNLTKEAVIAILDDFGDIKYDKNLIINEVKHAV